MVSSFRENEVHSPFPYCLDKRLFDQMVMSAHVLNGIVVRITEELIKHPESMPFQMGDFPLKDDILSLNLPMPPMFWVRYDAFVRADGGIFFSEFNYDKPCAQREIMISEMLAPENSPNFHFRSAFIENFRALCNSAFEKKERPTIAVVLSPTHDEEVHLSYLFMDLLKDLNCDFVIAGIDNLYVQDHLVWAFGKPVDLILKQFPTEFLHQNEHMQDILALYEKGNVVIINDPRSIIGQTKSLFAYLWSLVNSNSSFVSDHEKNVIRDTIPYTKHFNPDDIEHLILNQEKYVIKAVYGRYSEQVYIGCMLTKDEWKQIIDEVENDEQLHIVQEFCPIKKENILRYNGEVFEETLAHGNFGIYLSNNQFCGTCVRWSPDYLSADDCVWISPVSTRECSIQMSHLFGENDYRRIWNSINETAAFSYDFTGGYTGNQQSFALQSLILDQRTYNEMKVATECMTLLFKKTAQYAIENSTFIFPILGFSEEVSLMLSKYSTYFDAFISRFDWVFDVKGNLKVLEYNSETPAGIMESVVLNELILKESGKQLSNPNEHMLELIKSRYKTILNVYKKTNPMNNIGFVSLAYPEDWYNTKIVYDIVKDMSYNISLGEVSGLEAKNGKLFLYGTPMDAIYRYYPLEWFSKDPYYEGVMDAFGLDTPSINHPSTLITQSKAFLALIWELYQVDFYSEEEKGFVHKYIPFTSLDPTKIAYGDYVAKPYYGNEGEGVTFAIHSTKDEFTDQDMIFQQRIDIQSVNLDVYTTLSKSVDVVYPVLGAYVISEQFAGIYTRAGGTITDKNAIFVPTYVKM